MLNFKLIYKILGQLLFLEALLMSLCLAMALFIEKTTPWRLPYPLPSSWGLALC